MASVNLLIIGSGNGLLPVCLQAITKISVYLLSIGLLKISASDIWSKS